MKYDEKHERDECQSNHVLSALHRAHACCIMDGRFASVRCGAVFPLATSLEYEIDEKIDSPNRANR